MKRLHREASARKKIGIYEASDEQASAAGRAIFGHRSAGGISDLDSCQALLESSADEHYSMGTGDDNRGI